MKGLLIDSTRCIACRACQVACKEWNELPAEKTTFFGGPGYQNPADLSFKTWTLITFTEVEKNGELGWHFGKKQCMHCIEPACVSNCPEEIITKTPEGPVLVDTKSCVGCGTCLEVCPFGVPRYELKVEDGVMAKCTLCADRVQNGKQTSCATTCPTGAILFGEREELVETAKKRIKENKGRYVDHIYGLEEAGGTSVLHLTAVPAEVLGHKGGVKNSVYSSLISPRMWKSPIFLAGALGLSSFSWFTKRKEAVSKEEKGC